MLRLQKKRDLPNTPRGIDGSIRMLFRGFFSGSTSIWKGCSTTEGWNMI